MSGARLDDRLRRALGRAGLAAGTWCDAYRPIGSGPALDAANRFLRLPAAFLAKGDAQGGLWHGSFDAAYTRPGDYLRRDDGAIWFIAAREPLAPILCIRADRLLDIARPAGATRPGVNTYGGVAPETSAPLLTQWPASIAAASATGTANPGLPAGVPPGSWTVLLPASGVTLRPGDVLRDDLGRLAVVSNAEASARGWRLLARQAG